eukprot:490409_1
MSLVITFNQISMGDILDLYSSRGFLGDWYIFYGEMQSNNDTFIINNLEINNNTFGYDHMTEGIVYLYGMQGTLILNNAILQNINATDVHASAYTFEIPNLEIYNSTFSNINMSAYDTIHTFIYINNGNLMIKNCNINNLYFWDTHFIVSWQDESNQNYQVIENCIFNFSDTSNIFEEGRNHPKDLERMYSLIYFQYGRSNMDEVSVFINDCSFINYINIIHLDDRCHLSALLNNIDITVSYFKSYDLKNIERALIRVTETAKLTINNVNLTYKWLSKIESQSWYELPYRFISNAGSVIMNNIYITNDVTPELLDEYRDYVMSWNNFDNESIYDFEFNTCGSDSTSMIWNARGQMIINNITFYGVLLHKEILHNTGIVFMNNFNLLRPDYYYDEIEIINFKSCMGKVIFNEGMNYDLTSNTCAGQNCYFEDINLHLANAIIIINSQINGGTFGIADEFGYVEIHNTLISDVTIAIHAYQSAVFKLASSHLKNVGIYNLGDFSAKRRYIDGYGNVQVYFWNCKQILIEDNLFEFVPQNHYLYFKTEDKNINTFIEIINNDFVNYSPITPPNTDCPGLYTKDHLVNIEGYIQSSTVIGNMFPENDLIVSFLNKSCLYVNDYNWLQNDAYESFHCISGNIFYGSAVYLERGKISSCIHPNLSININGQCWSEFGSLNIKNDSIIYGYFIATDINIPMITLLHQSHIILDKVIISTNFSKYSNYTKNAFYNPLSLTETNGIISFLDVIIDDHNHSNDSIDIKFYNCINLCTEVYNTHYIHQLQLNCIDTLPILEMVSISNIMNNISLTHVNHTTPMKLILNSSQELYPGGRLNISYVIVDIYNNTIHNYKGNIDLTFMSNEFNFETVMNIIDVTETGLYIQNIRMSKSAHHNYTITTSVNKNILLTNNLSVTVIECPSGFGLHQIVSQCFECNIGEFSIKPSMSSCFKCNSNSLKGAQCLGGNKISIAHNYWIGIHNITNNLKLINETIISQFCPSNNCNQQNNRLYLELKEENKLCATNRDPNSLLCSNCITEYSEVIGSNTCRKCSRNNWWLLIVPFIFSVFIVSVMIVVDHPNTPHNNENKSEINYVKLLTKDDLQSLQITFLRPFVYFFQGLSYITIQTGLWFHLSPVISLFSFDFFAQNSKESGICFLKDLKSIDKELWQLYFPFCMFIVVGIVFVVNIFLKSKYNKNIIGLDMVWR